ncbi:MAG: hypothetical protein FJZ01_09125 [Candidatus Sericytochromatia bacterium]|nr:hypothetical protein [Candidatus Tanganyikabacteria bacterium]
MAVGAVRRPGTTVEINRPPAKRAQPAAKPRESARAAADAGPPRPKSLLEGIGEFLGNLLFGRSDLPTDGDSSHVHVTPRDATGKEPILFVNGAGADFAASAAGVADLSERIGRNVRLVHNATAAPQFGDPIRNLLGGFLGFLFGDVRQILDNQQGKGHDPAVAAVRDQVLERLRAGKPVELAGHSQGTHTVATALRQAYDIRSRELLGDRTLLAREFGQVKVLNVSGPVKRQDYPPFVQYEHAELPGDPVVRHLGELSTGNRDADYEGRLYRAVFELGGSGGSHDPRNVLAESGENLRKVRAFFA